MTAIFASCAPRFRFEVSGFGLGEFLKDDLGAGREQPCLHYQSLLFRFPAHTTLPRPIAIIRDISAWACVLLDLAQATALLLVE
jgi:hypothetical protein